MSGSYGDDEQRLVTCDQCGKKRLEGDPCLTCGPSLFDAAPSTNRTPRKDAA